MHQNIMAQLVLTKTKTAQFSSEIVHNLSQALMGLYNRVDCLLLNPFPIVLFTDEQYPLSEVCIH